MSGHAHVVWPAERFYWAELDAARLGRMPTSRALGFLFEAELPVALESIHAIYVPIGGARFIACGADRERLAELVRGSAAALTLTPESLPAFTSGGPDSRHMNLLTGVCEPPAVRRARRRCVGVALGLAAMCLLLSFVGMERRIRTLGHGGDDLDHARLAVLATAIGPAAQQPNADLLIGGELSRLRATRADVAETARGQALPEDAAGLLAGVLAAWPRDLVSRTESLSLTPSSVTVSGTVSASSDAQRLADALATASLPARSTGGSWRATQPRFDARDGEAAFTIHLDRAEARR